MRAQLIPLEGGPPIEIVKDLIVVQKDHSLLVASRDKDQLVKRILEGGT